MQMEITIIVLLWFIFTTQINTIVLLEPVFKISPLRLSLSLSITVLYRSYHNYYTIRDIHIIFWLNFNRVKFYFGICIKCK